MALRLLTGERYLELENEVESYRIGMENMAKAHERAVQSYRELRDAKDAEIARLHEEIEMLKADLAEARKREGRHRQAIAYYEALRTEVRNANKTAV